MDFDEYMECLRRNYSVHNDKIDLKAMFKKFEDIDPNENVDPKNPDCRPLLYLAIEEEKEEVVNFILHETKIKANPELMDSKTNMTPLALAIQ
jgi:ankyrin repeat protein